MFAVFDLFFEDLLNGDPVALSLAGIIAFVFLLFCLVWWRIARNLRREDEERQRRFRGWKKKR
jgi:hypothetical protein